MDAEALTQVLTRSTGKGARLDLYDLLAGMYDVVRTLCNFTVNHVHAHDWHPRNKIVDSVAKITAMLDLAFPPPTGLDEQIAASQADTWAWMYDMQGFAPAYPAFDGQCFADNFTVPKDKWTPSFGKEGRCADSGGHVGVNMADHGHTIVGATAQKQNGQVGELLPAQHGGKCADTWKSCWSG